MSATSVKESLIELEVPTQPEFLRIVRLLVSGFASRWPLSFDEVENVKVAVSEACNVAIQQCSDAEARLRIRCWRTGSRLYFEVRDKNVKQGFAFAQDDDLMSAGEAGLGYLLIQTLMDDVKAVTRPNSGTTVTMTKKFTIN